MLAISVSVPSENRKINAAIADHVPVAELIPHLIQPEPGQHWVLYRAVGQIRPEHSLAQAGVLPGEQLTLDVARVPEPPQDAVDELTDEVGPNDSAWIAAGITAVFATLVVNRAPWEWHPLSRVDLGALWGGSVWTAHAGFPQPWLVLAATAVASLLLAAGSLYDRRFAFLSSAVGFGVGLHINVLCGCVAGALLAWRSGTARLFWVVTALAAAVNVMPGFTLVLALTGYVYAGQIAVAVAGVKIPKVPATGLFSEPTLSRTGSVREVHAALVVALCVVITCCLVQILPWGEQASWPVAVLFLAIAGIGLSSRGTRPVHAVAAVTLAAGAVLWLAASSPLAVVGLVVLALPAVKVSSPLLGRVLDAVEAVAFCAAVPLALYTTGIFEFIRGLGG